MTGAEMIECGQLMEAKGAGTLADYQQVRLTALLARAKAEAPAPEVADDPATLLVDESRRPNLDGTDYNDTLRRICCDEVTDVLTRALETLGREALQAVVRQAMGG